MIAGHLGLEILQAHPGSRSPIIPAPCHLPGVLGVTLELELDQECGQLVLSWWLQGSNLSLQIYDSHKGVLSGLAKPDPGFVPTSG